MNVLYVFADTPQEWNCSEWNCIIPTKAINRTGNHNAQALFINEFVQNSEQSQKLCGGADIIVVERNLFGDTLTMMEYWKERNKPIAANRRTIRRIADRITDPPVFEAGLANQNRFFRISDQLLALVMPQQGDHDGDGTQAPSEHGENDDQATDVK